MKQPVLCLTMLFAVLLFSGCSASSEPELGNYIVAKEEQRILVAKHISAKDAESKTIADLQKSNIELINYIVEDSELYHSLHIGDKVKVTPQSDDKGQYVVMQSDPPQIIAREIAIE